LPKDPQEVDHHPLRSKRPFSQEPAIMSRRALIVTDVTLACLFLLAGVANFALGEPVSIIAGISALALGATAAVTACLFITSGGWTSDEVPNADSDQRALQSGRTPDQQ
jgi:hypothetical protein